MNSTRLSALFWLFLLFLAQNTIHFFLGSWNVPLVLIAVVFYALLEGPRFGFVLGCLAGFLFDIFGIGKIGYEIAIFGAMGGGVGFLSSKIFRESILTQLALPCLAHYFSTFLNLIVFRPFLQDEPFRLGFFIDAFVWHELLAVFLLSPWVFKFLKRVSFVREEKSSTWES